MSRSTVRRSAVLAAIASFLLAFPAATSATISGGCTGTGTATSGGVDLTTATEWHVLSTDVGGGTGHSPTKVKAASVGAFAAGIAVPIANGTSEDGETEGSVSGVSVSMFSALGKRFVVSGSADNGCSGQITIIIDDVNPFLTALGGGGLIALVLALLVLIWTSRTRGGAAKILAVLFGALGGLGLGLLLEQLAVLDPTQPISLIIAAVVAILGLILAGRFAPSDATMRPMEPPTNVGMAPPSYR